VNCIRSWNPVPNCVISNSMFFTCSWALSSTAMSLHHSEASSVSCKVQQAGGKNWCIAERFSAAWCDDNNNNNKKKPRSSGDYLSDNQEHVLSRTTQFPNNPNVVLKLWQLWVVTGEFQRARKCSTCSKLLSYWSFGPSEVYVYLWIYLYECVCLWVCGHIGCIWSVRVCAWEWVCVHEWMWVSV
jgi:hypothetical protein